MPSSSRPNSRWSRPAAPGCRSLLPKATVGRAPSWPRWGDLPRTLAATQLGIRCGRCPRRDEGDLQRPVTELPLHPVLLVSRSSRLVEVFEDLWQDERAARGRRGRHGPSDRIVTLEDLLQEL